MNDLALTVLILALAQADAAEVAPSPSAMDRRVAQENVLLALTDSGHLVPELTQKIAGLWTSDVATLDAIVLSAAAANAEVAALLETARVDAKSSREVARELDAKVKSPFLRANVATYLGREMVRRRLFDEALPLLSPETLNPIADPATLLFHRSACEYALHQTEAAKKTLALLLEMKDLPSRYRASATAMNAALESLAPESLHGIAHDMKDVHRRLDLKQADEKVVTIEQDILARLDKLIEEMENEAQEDSSSEGNSGGSSPAKPAEESRLLGGQGEGEVDDKTFDDDMDWGNLPDKERERALQPAGRDFGHYRDAIEQYFRKLATQK
jgi:hypothetical protein